MTADQARASCLATGATPEECAALVAEQSVNGAYCDGRIVLDARGPRCVPRATLERKANVLARERAADPDSLTALERARTSAPSGRGDVFLVLALVVGVGVLAALASRG